MFEFLDEDWFVVGLEILFLIFIAYDTWKYIKTKKREYIINIVVAIGFAIWVLYPFYTKYYTWTPQQRDTLMQNCLSDNNTSYCSCIKNNTVKEYDFEIFTAIDKKQDKEYLEFIGELEKGCLED